MDDIHYIFQTRKENEKSVQHSAAHQNQPKEDRVIMARLWYVSAEKYFIPTTNQMKVPILIHCELLFPLQIFFY